MKARCISLRTAVMVPFISVILAIVLMFIFIVSSNYKYLLNEQGGKVMLAISNSAQERLRNLMAEPLRITTLMSDFIARDSLYDEEDLAEIERYIHNMSELMHQELPQISAIAYGDEKARFAGMRIDDSGHNNLMLSDERTGGKLVIFEGENTGTRRLAEYEDYDPRTRPWYDVVVKDSRVRWSEIYVNYDERMEATITTMSPVIGSDGLIKGVIGIDVKLTGINDFLRAEIDSKTSSIYIVDEDWNLLAHSGDETVMLTHEGNPPVGELMKAGSSENLLIRESSDFLLKNSFELYVPMQIEIRGKDHFVLVSQMKEPQGLNWRAVIVIPEEQLMGLMISRRNMIILLTLLITIIGCAVGFITLSRVMEPVIKSSRAAAELSMGNWDTELAAGKWHLRETEDLVTAFNNMAAKLKYSFEKLKLNEEEIRRLHEKEKDRLERLVQERTEDLQAIMQELVHKEKLASLGGIVSGIAHEINTPLGVAVSAASYLEKVNNSNMKLIEAGSMTRSDFMRYIDAIEETAVILNTNLERAAELVKSFKLIAVSQSNEMKSSFNLYSYIHTVLISLKHEYKNADIVFDIRCSEDIVINSYSGAFSQIFTNLIMNSLIHGFQGKGGGIVVIDVREEGELLLITYSDNGIGIPEENIGRIFEPFFTTGRSSGGSGLGLSVVYNIVTGQLGGKISCRSTLGEGTIFIMEIPMDRGMSNG